MVDIVDNAGKRVINLKKGKMEGKKKSVKDTGKKSPKSKTK